MVVCTVVVAGTYLYFFSALFNSLFTITVTPLSGKWCNILVHIVSACGTIATCLCTFLFLARVRGVFRYSRRIIHLFTILWIFAVLGVLSTTPFSFSATSAIPIGRCGVSRVERFEAVGSITVSVFDTAVFLSISYYAMSVYGLGRSRWANVWPLFCGSSNAPITTALLRTGQLYIW